MSAEQAILRWHTTLRQTGGIETQPVTPQVADAVTHPSEWPWYRCCEIQSPQQRYNVVDQQSLMELLDICCYKRMQLHHKCGVDNALMSQHQERVPVWTTSLAVDSHEFVDHVKGELGISGEYRRIAEES